MTLKVLLFHISLMKRQMEKFKSNMMIIWRKKLLMDIMVICSSDTALLIIFCIIMKILRRNWIWIYLAFFTVEWMVQTLICPFKENLLITWEMNWIGNLSTPSCFLLTSSSITAYRKRIAKIPFDLDSLFHDLPFFFKFSSRRREDYASVAYVAGTTADFVKNTRSTFCSHRSITGSKRRCKIVWH